MPKKGFTSITFAEEKYDRFKAYFDHLKKNDRLPPGVHSLSGLIDYCISTKIEEQQQLRNIASKILVIPSKFITTYGRINLEMCKIE